MLNSCYFSLFLLFFFPLSFLPFLSFFPLFFPLPPPLVFVVLTFGHSFQPLPLNAGSSMVPLQRC